MVLTMDVSVVTLKSSVDYVIQLASQHSGAYVCVGNVHMCMEAFDSSDFRSIVNSADLALPDGKPLSIAQRLLGHKEAQQVRGEDIMNALCALSGNKNIKLGFYGGSSDDVLKAVQRNLVARYPDIQISYACSPPFRELTPEEDQTVVSEISAADVDVLFVGIGCPKQEIWMANHKDRLNCVMLGVGAAFDFIAGNKRHAPRWVQKIGCEWLFRFFCEPRRLWKRYLKHNPRFVWYFLQQWLLKKDFKTD